MDNQEFLSDFLEESYDLIDKVKIALSDWEGSENREELINSIYRWVHTIKGGCAVFNYKNTSATAHELETKLGSLRKDHRKISPEDLRMISREINLIESILRNQDELPEKVVDEFSFETDYFGDFYQDSEFIIKDMTKDGFSFFELSFPSGIAPKAVEALRAHGLDALQEVDTDGRTAFLMFVKEDLHGLGQALIEKYQGRWCHLQQSSVDEGATPKEIKSAPTPQGEVLRVPLKTVNSILDNIWDLFLVHNQMSHLMQQNAHLFKENFSFLQQFEALDTLLERNIHELESRSMSMRMNPIGRVFERMVKVVEDYCQQNKKQVLLKTSGDNIDLDKKILDSLNEPLIHLIRNAMDHGIENPDERLSAGKSKEGVIKLSAIVSGSEVHLTISDDGKGIDAQKVLASAKKKGMDVSQLKTEQDIINLIFEPGFSTAEKVSDVSGRGVGMDAVVKSLKEMGGELQLSTKIGVGTQFKIILPLSVSVSKSLIVKVKDLKYAISTKSILSVEKVDIHSLKKNGSEEFYEFNGELIPCFDLGPALPDNQKYPDLPMSETHVCVTVVKGSYKAFRVDDIVQTLNVVMKPISKLVKKSPLLSGVSILPGGDPIFVLNIPELISKLGGRDGHFA